MRKKIYSVALACVLTMSLGITAFAGTSSRGGSTSGGASGVLNTSAYLSVDKNRAMAETTAGSTDRVTLLTTVTFKYTNSNNQVSTVSTKGAGYAYAGNQDGKGISGSSQHSVQGGTTWGNWSCNLSTNI